MSALPALAAAQVTPAAGYTPFDDAPSIRIGATIFTDYTFTQAPEITDADGNTVHSSAFNVGRSYININGNISRLVSFRITPDITRESGTGSSLNGSLVFRVKYAFLQANLDDWMWRGSWVRLGIQQTPVVDFEEGIYRYRFQGSVFVEREGFLTSSDAGASFHTNFPKNYGDLHVGFYNGEGYSRVEANNEKAFQIRGTVRPLPRGALMRGLRVTGFWDADHYIKNGARRRGMVMATFEHPHLNAGLDYLDASDRTLLSSAKLDARGFSFWATPRFTKGFEGLLRVDRVTPNRGATAELHRNRTIVGGAYWFPHQGSVSAAVLLDYEQVKAARTGGAAAPPTQKRIAVHGLINF
ncbi:MAG: hypothetical protein EXQ55_03690 [Acidobacteria bacterium]|nr:hypothetical protein [Acidobacteriota bacterium]